MTAPPAFTARLRYRVWQAVSRLRARPLAPEDLTPVTELLPPAGQRLFATMSPDDQRHCLNVMHGLEATGCTDHDLLAAALLHDVGKGDGRVRFPMRVAIVLLKATTPRILTKLAGPNALASVPRWRRPFRDAWHHAELGAILAEQHGLSPRVSLLIRTHHDPSGPAAALHAVDQEW